jgi:mxaJ protein
MSSRSERPQGSGIWGLGSGPALSRGARVTLCIPAAVLMAFAAPRYAAGRSPLDPKPSTPDPGVLRVCADPNNLPFSNEREQGFENRIARLVARELHSKLEYTWSAQRRGFVRNTLAAGACDVLLGVPAGFERATTTAPYYRSTYVFVWPKAKHYGIHSFDDPRLRRLRVGVQLVGDDYANTPPAHALSRRGIVQNVKGYRVQGDYSQPNPPARIVEAVANGEVDVAVVWGPLAGYFAKRQPVPLELAPVSPRVDPPGLPLTFAIAMGVRRGDTALRDSLQRVIDRRRPEIRRILDAYGVPQVDAP